MQLKMFSIPALDPGDAVEEMNVFLRTHRILSLDRRLVGADATAFWAVSVEYLERGAEGTGVNGARSKDKVDYKEVLNPADFAVFSKLRELRKAIAEKEAIPPYSVFTNEQLAAMVTGKVDSVAGLGRIDGVGTARIEKYGPRFLEALKDGTRKEAA
jgi:superfamily II DNA helicase RecQ